jgi:anti-sigma factor RsiW
MSGSDGNSEENGTDRALWLRSQATAAPDNEFERFLDLAAFADGQLDDEEAERVAALLAADPEVASDVAAAVSAKGNWAPVVEFGRNAEIKRVIARACALASPGYGGMPLFARPALRLGAMRGLAEWTSLAAALAMVGWFGFAMGSDASLAFAQSAQVSEPSIVHELTDPDNGVLHDLGVELRT